MGFNVTKIYRTPAGWVKQLDSGKILGPVETEALAKALEEDSTPVETPTSKGKKAQTDASAAK